MQPTTHDARAIATYDALMWAMSRPGTVRQMPAEGEEALIEALIDRECAVWTESRDLGRYAAQTGAALVQPNEADHLFAGTLEGVELLAQIRCGSDLYPDAGATLVVRGDLAHGPDVTLSGPGVDGQVRVPIGGLPDGFWQARAQAFRYPMGFEVFILCGSRVLGIPRSTDVEIG